LETQFLQERTAYSGAENTQMLQHLRKTKTSIVKIPQQVIIILETSRKIKFSKEDPNSKIRTKK
jgi:hypothetical protein